MGDQAVFLLPIIANYELFFIFAPLNLLLKEINKLTMGASQDEMSFLDHLEALRWHLIRATIAVLIVGVVAFVCKDFLFQIIFAP